MGQQDPHPPKKTPNKTKTTHLSKLKNLWMHFWVYLEVDSPWVSIGSMCLHPPSSGAVNAPHTSNGDGSVLRTLPGQAPPPCVSTFLLSGLHGWEKVPHVEATHMFLAPLPFSPSLHLALKSTPDDFFFAPLSSYNPSFSPPRSFTRHGPSAAPASLYVLSFSNRQACVQTLCPSLKSCELLPHSGRPLKSSPCSRAPSGSSCRLPAVGRGG